MGDLIRVFPRKTNATPDDELAFVGMPGPMFLMEREIEQVNVSVTFSWDIPAGEEIAEEIACMGIPVDIGGPAYGDRMSEEFTPGMYLKKGYTITSRGCPNECWFCSVYTCSRGRVIELPVQEGWNIMDDNLLATSRAHFDEVIDMLKRQKLGRPAFTGGIEAKIMTQYHANRIHECHPKSVYLAYDTKDDYEPLLKARTMFREAGFSDKTHTLQCYVLVGYPEDTMEEAEKRLYQTIDAGYIPFAMLYRSEEGYVREDWKSFASVWANRYRAGALVKAYLGGKK